MIEVQQTLNSNVVPYGIMYIGISEYDLIGARWNCRRVIPVIQLIRSSGAKAVRGLCAQFVITKFIVLVCLNLTYPTVQAVKKSEFGKNNIKKA